jgi:hypothetical protein
MLLADLVENKQPRTLASCPSLTFVWATHENGLRVLPGQNALRVDLPRNVASLSAKDEPKQLKMGPKEAPQFTEGDAV